MAGTLPAVLRHGAPLQAHPAAGRDGRRRLDTHEAHGGVIVGVTAELPPGESASCVRTALHIGRGQLLAASWRHPRWGPQGVQLCHDVFSEAVHVLHDGLT